MTEVEGSLKQLGQGKTQKTYNYEPLGSLVDIVFNSAGKFPAAASTDSPTNKPPTGQVLQATTQKDKDKNGGGGGSSSSASASSTPMPVSLPVSTAASTSTA
jgi:hypothetical protein